VLLLKVMKVFTSQKGCVLGCCLAILGCIGNSSRAQDILIGWDFPVNSTVSSASSTSTVAGVVGPKSFAMASGLSANVFISEPYAWGASGWTPDGTLPGPNATTNNDYFSFEIEVATGKKVTISGISRLILQVSASGPKKWSLLYSDSDSNSAFDPSPLRNYGPFEVANPAKAGEILDTDITALVNAAIAANPIILTAGKTGYFRLVGFGGSSTSGSGRILANALAGTWDFALTGKVEDMPKTSQTITFSSFGRALLGDEPLSLGASASSGLAVTYVSLILLSHRFLGTM